MKIKASARWFGASGGQIMFVRKANDVIVFAGSDAMHEAYDQEIPFTRLRSIASGPVHCRKCGRCLQYGHYERALCGACRLTPQRLRHLQLFIKGVKPALRNLIQEVRR